MLDEERPVYTIGTASEILSVHPRTLRLYEDAGLLRPARKNNRRFYTANDLTWITCIRYMIHEQGLNQEGLRRLLALIPCWEISACPSEAKARCPARTDRSTPCWDLARREADESKECYRCVVYSFAWRHLLSPDELAAARGYRYAPGE
jgi:MerR family transcriptional regulator/heat shock protein HspR